MDSRTSGLSPIAKLILKAYEIDTRGHAAFLTDRIRKAMISDAMFYIMLTRHEESGHKPMGDYVTANIEVQRYLEI